MNRRYCSVARRQSGGRFVILELRDQFFIKENNMRTGAALLFLLISFTVIGVAFAIDNVRYVYSHQIFDVGSDE